MDKQIIRVICTDYNTTTHYEIVTQQIGKSRLLMLRKINIKYENGCSDFSYLPDE